MAASGGSRGCTAEGRRPTQGAVSAGRALLSSVSWSGLPVKQFQGNSSAAAGIRTRSSPHRGGHSSPRRGQRGSSSSVIKALAGCAPRDAKQACPVGGPPLLSGMLGSLGCKPARGVGHRRATIQRGGAEEGGGGGQDG